MSHNLHCAAQCINLQSLLPCRFIGKNKHFKKIKKVSFKKIKKKTPALLAGGGLLF